MLSGFIGLIRKEASNAREGKKARIVVQVNGLTEAAIVAELYAASQVRLVDWLPFEIRGQKLSRNMLIWLWCPKRLN